MDGVRLFREKNEFYLQINGGRWWNADRWSITPYNYSMECKPCPTNGTPPEKEEKPPYKHWQVCSKLDYLMILGRSLDRDIRALEALIKEAWISGRYPSRCEFRDGKVCIRLRNPDNPVGNPYAKYILSVPDVRKDEALIEIEY